MHGIHAKLMAAKTGEERPFLMGEHIRAMQDGMGILGHIKVEKGGMFPEAMAKRMEVMMQMMMGRAPAFE